MFFDRIVSLHLATMGIISNQRYQKFEKIVFGALITLDIISFVTYTIAAFRSEVYIHTSYCVSGILTSLCFFLHRCVGYRKRKEILNITEKLQNDPPNFINNQVKNNTEVNLQKMFMPTFKIICFNAILLGFYPYFRVLLTTDVNYNDPGLYLAPHLYHFWNIDSFGGFVMLTILQNASNGFICSVYLSFIAIINYILCNIRAHIHEINQQLGKYINADQIHSTHCRSKNKGRKEIQNCGCYSRDEFIPLIQYQQYLQQYVQKF